MKTKNSRNDQRPERRKEAEERQAVYDGLTHAEKVAQLDAKFGNGKGALRQRIRLAKEVTNAG